MFVTLMAKVDFFSFERVGRSCLFVGTKESVDLLNSFG
jgi:hypothetical protein